MRRVRGAFSLVRGVVIAGAAATRAAVRGDGFLSLVQVGGLLVVADGIEDWSPPAAKVFLGLAAVAVTVVWSIRGDGDGDERA